MPGPTSGLRVQVTGQPPIYFTLDGKYHHVPNPTVYVRLFPGGGAVLQETSIASEYIGDPLGGDADVLKGDGADPVYFYNNGKKRHILQWSFLARAFGACRT